MHLAAKLSTAALIAFATAAATAQPAPTPTPLEKMATRGGELAAKLCASCHLTPGSNLPGQAAAPTFRAIANVPDQTGTRIRNVLINPGHQMPDVSVTNEEIIALIAWLDTLRTDRAKPLLTGPDDDRKSSAPKKS